MLSISEIINLVIFLATILFGFLALWYKSNAKLAAKASDLIAAAENQYKGLTKAGGQKFEWVADQLYALIPAALRPFVPRSLIATLVQSTFDAVQGYATQQLDRLAEKARKEGAVRNE